MKNNRCTNNTPFRYSMAIVASIVIHMLFVAGLFWFLYASMNHVVMQKRYTISLNAGEKSTIVHHKNSVVRQKSIFPVHQQRATNEQTRQDTNTSKNDINTSVPSMQSESNSTSLDGDEARFYALCVASDAQALREAAGLCTEKSGTFFPFALFCTGSIDAKTIHDVCIYLNTKQYVDFNESSEQNRTFDSNQSDRFKHDVDSLLGGLRAMFGK